MLILNFTLLPINMVLRLFVIFLVKKKKHTTLTSQSDDIMKILTVVDCFMRVVLYVLINASLKDYTS
jgi:hypothetical protein